MTSSCAWYPIAEKIGLLVGRSPEMCRLLTMAYKIARKNVPVLIQGETGTGKDLLARFIHASSNRAHKIYIPVNCGALAEGIEESELFGHEKGAFTNADQLRRGVFERADRGTLFLDEIGEAGIQLQVKLLRVLGAGEFIRIGGERIIKVDVRFIAATNMDLEQAVLSGVFRKDLYYRLSVVQLKIPPLRERIEDIPLYVNYMLKKESPHISISPAALRLLCKYQWPGNVRQLFNVVRLAAAVCDHNTIRPEHLKDKILAEKPAFDKINGNAFVTRAEHVHGLKSSPGEKFQLVDLESIVKYYSTKPFSSNNVERIDTAGLLQGLRSLEKKIMHTMQETGLEPYPL